MNKDRSGLGFNSQNLKRLEPKVGGGQVLSLLETFASVGHLIEGQICVVEEEGVSVAMEE